MTLPQVLVRLTILHYSLVPVFQKLLQMEVVDQQQQLQQLQHQTQKQLMAT